jgi:hypothetical protein
MKTLTTSLLVFALGAAAATFWHRNDAHYAVQEEDDYMQAKAGYCAADGRHMSLWIGPDGKAHFGCYGL